MELSAKIRTRTGSKVKTLRDENLIPAVIYSKKSSRKEQDTLLLTVPRREFEKVYAEAGESSLVTVNIDGEKPRKVLISEVQYEPVWLKLLHVSLHEVDLTEKLEASIPVEIVGEEDCFAVTSGAGIIVTILHEIEVRSLPTDLPKDFQVNVSELSEVGQNLTVADATASVDHSKVEIVTPLDEVVVKLDYAEQQEVVEEELKSVEDVEVISEKKEGKEGEPAAETPAEEKKDS